MTDHATALAALNKAAVHLDEDDYEALSDLVALFEPYDGDDPEEARQRGHMKGHCHNCGYEAPLVFFPAIADHAMRSAIRLSKCPRCFSTKMMCGPTPKTTETEATPCR